MRFKILVSNNHHLIQLLILWFQNCFLHWYIVLISFLLFYIPILKPKKIFLFCKNFVKLVFNHISTLLLLNFCYIFNKNNKQEKFYKESINVQFVYKYMKTQLVSTSTDVNTMLIWKENYKGCSHTWDDMIHVTIVPKSIHEQLTSIFARWPTASLLKDS